MDEHTHDSPDALGAAGGDSAFGKSGLMLRSVTDSVKDAILMMDPQGNVSYWNPAAEHVLGYTASEAIGRNLHALLVPQRYLKAHEAAMPTFRRTGQGAAIGRTLEVEAIRKDGTEVSVQLSLSSVPINGAWHAVGVIRDITERLQAEKELREARRWVEEATAAAHEMALKVGVAMAAESDFLAKMSHDVLNPMNEIIGMSGLLLDAELTAEQRRYAAIVHASGENLLSLLSDILDFSRIESGRLSLEDNAFDLHALVEETIASPLARAKSKDIDFTCIISPDVPHCLQGDRNRLGQILANFTGNAVKFTRQGGVAVHVGLVSETSEEAVLRFTVQDTGIGIADDRKSQIFRKLNGSAGLGLFISKELVAKMGGETGFSSVEGQGAEFWFTVRLRRSSEPGEGPGVRDGGCRKEQPRAAAATAADRGNDPDRSAFRILLVEDNLTNQLVAAGIMKKMGFAVDAVSSGAEALERLESVPYDLAFMDVQMPGMDGLEVARRIREPASAVLDHAMPVIAMTAHSQPGDRERFLKAGMDDYVAKPVSPDVLSRMLDRWLLHNAAPQEAGLPDGGAAEAVPDGTSDPPLQEETAALEAMGRMPLRLLLVDDSEDNRLLVLAYLKKTRFLIDIAENGSEAVEKFSKNQYDLILMDMQMPVMDGYAATREIRRRERDERRGHTPVVSITAHSLREDLQKSFDAGCDAHLTKPIRKTVLMRAIRKYAVFENVAHGGQNDE